MKFQHLIILLVPMLMAATCEKEASELNLNMPEGGQELTITVVSDGGYSSMEEAKQMLITDEESFYSLWAEIHQNQMPAPKPPRVDFSTNMVVASFMGMQTSGGYSTSLSKAVFHNELVYFLVQETLPGPGCLTTSAITYPYVLAMVEKKSMSDHHFIIARDTTNCMN